MVGEGKGLTKEDQRKNEQGNLLILGGYKGGYPDGKGDRRRPWRPKEWPDGGVDQHHKGQGKADAQGPAHVKDSFGPGNGDRHYRQ